MSRHMYQKIRQSPIEQNINDAIQRVYATYGTDLAAFFKHVQAESQRKQQIQQPSRSEDVVPPAIPRTRGERRKGDRS